MPDVCDGTMAKELCENGLFGFIHRFNSIREQMEETDKLGFHYFGCAIGINKGWEERFIKLYDCGVTDFIIDTANGSHTRVADCIESVLRKDKTINIVAGNVCTKEGYNFLAQYPLAGIRVGIGGGAACSTKFQTGVHLPLASAIMEVAQERKDSFYSKPLIIADGGINNTHDFCVALALGADLCMAGKIFASTKQSPAKVLNIDGKLKKIYRGAASFSTQIEHSGNKPEYVEGFETIIDYDGDLKDVIKRFSGGLRSAMSYMNAMNLIEFREKSNFCIKAI
jgi:IMP dehydrogenase